MQARSTPDSFFGLPVEGDENPGHETKPPGGSGDPRLMGVLAFLRPQASPFPLVRIGGDGDGAYLVPDDLRGIRACFSPSVANRKPFEDELLNSRGIDSHLCDYSSDPDMFSTPLVPGRQTFRRKLLDVYGGPNSLSLEAWVTETNIAN